MKHFKNLLLVWLALAGGLLPAQTPKPAERPPGRYLFIVETSSAMRRRAGSVQDAVQSLLRSDLNGELREGDTLGIWTFNEELYAGQFPLQSWSPESREAVALAVGAFLKKQRYEKQTRFESVLSGLDRVINSSASLTVVLVSAGEMEIPGTLFGREINAAYAQWSREMERTCMPFITVLRARNGQIAGRSVNMAPWPVSFPELPPEPAPAVAAKPPHYVPLKEPLPAPAPKRSSPIILDMSDSAKAGATQTGKARTALIDKSTAPAPVTPEPVAPEAKVQHSDVPQAALPPAAIPKSPDSLPATTVDPDPNPPPPASAPTVPVAVPKTEPLVATVPSAPSVETTKIPAAEPATGKIQAAAIEAKPMSNSSPDTATPPPPLESKSAATLADPRQAANSTGTAGATPALPEPTPPAPSSPPGQTAVAVPPETFLSGKMLIVAALILLTALVGLLITFLRRSRTAPHASLITRSMDRKED